MADTFSTKQIKQLQEVISAVVDSKLDTILDQKLDQKLAPLHENIDKILKIVADDRDELEITKGRVSNHEVRISSLESVCAN